MRPSLTPCPDCGRAVSVHAPACPGCGRPMHRMTSALHATAGGGTILWIAIGAGVLLLGLAVAIALIVSGDQQRKPEPTKPKNESVLVQDVVHNDFRFEGDDLYRTADLSRPLEPETLTDVKITVTMKLATRVRRELLREWTKTYQWESWFDKELKHIQIPAEHLAEGTIEGSARRGGELVRIHGRFSPIVDIEPQDSHFDEGKIRPVGPGQSLAIRRWTSDSDWGKSDIVLACRYADGKTSKHRFSWPSWKRGETKECALPGGNIVRVELLGVAEEQKGNPPWWPKRISETFRFQ